MLHGFIYGLYDPDSGELRYIGQTTKNPVELRLKAHLCPSSLRRHSYLARWLKGVVGRGGRPIIQSLACATSQEDLDVAEIEMITQARHDGVRLVNLSDGGGGRAGFHPSKASVEKTAAAQRGVPKPKHTPEWCAMMSQLMKGRNPNPSEHYERLAAAKRGVPRPPHVRDAVRLANLGRPSSMKGKELSAEVRAKVSASRRGKAGGQNHHAWRSDLSTSEILSLLSQGLTKVEVAKQLGVSATFIHRRLAPLRAGGARI